MKKKKLQKKRKKGKRRKGGINLFLAAVAVFQVAKRTWSSCKVSHCFCILEVSSGLGCQKLLRILIIPGWWIQIKTPWNFLLHMLYWDVGFCFMLWRRNPKIQVFWTTFPKEFGLLSWNLLSKELNSKLPPHSHFSWTKWELSLLWI